MIGWNWLSNSTKWHFFDAGGRSACGRWFALSLTDAPRTDIRKERRCVGCDKVLDKRVARLAKAV